MPLPLIRRALHDVQIAGLQAERDKANTEKRQIGAALNEALRERDALQARLDALTPARGERGRFVGEVGSGGITSSERYDTIASTLPTPPETNA